MKMLALSAAFVGLAAFAAPAIAGTPTAPPPPTNTTPTPPAPPTQPLPSFNYNLGGGFQSVSQGGGQFDGPGEGYSLSEGGTGGSAEFALEGDGQGCTTDCSRLSWMAKLNANAFNNSAAGAMSGTSGVPALTMTQSLGGAGVTLNVNQGE